MPQHQEIYDQITKEVIRLKKWKSVDQRKEEIDFIISTYIFVHVNKPAPSNDLEALKKEVETFKEGGLANEEVIQQALKILGIMEISDTWDEFKSLADKKNKKKPKELTDFDKILKGMLAVPPLKKDKPSK